MNISFNQVFNKGSDGSRIELHHTIHKYQKNIRRFGKL